MSTELVRWEDPEVPLVEAEEVPGTAIDYTTEVPEEKSPIIIDISYFINPDGSSNQPQDQENQQSSGDSGGGGKGESDEEGQSSEEGESENEESSDESDSCEGESDEESESDQDSEESDDSNNESEPNNGDGSNESSNESGDGAGSGGGTPEEINIDEATPGGDPFDETPGEVAVAPTNHEVQSVESSFVKVRTKDRTLVGY